MNNEQIKKIKLIMNNIKKILSNEDIKPILFFTDSFMLDKIDKIAKQEGEDRIKYISKHFQLYLRKIPDTKESSIKESIDYYDEEIRTMKQIKKNLKKELIEIIKK